MVVPKWIILKNWSKTIYIGNLTQIFGKSQKKIFDPLLYQWWYQNEPFLKIGPNEKKRFILRKIIKNDYCHFSFFADFIVGYFVKIANMLVESYVSAVFPVRAFELSLRLRKGDFKSRSTYFTIWLKLDTNFVGISVPRVVVSLLPWKNGLFKYTLIMIKSLFVKQLRGLNRKSLS